MFIPDLYPHIYHIPTGHPGVLAVGWLDGKHEFPTGNIGVRVAWKIRRLAKRPVLLYRGFHICEMCPVPSGGNKAPPQEVVRNGEVWLEVPDGVIYAFPTLLTHYIGRHQYLPPPAFVSAVKLGRPLSEDECQERIIAHRSRLAEDPKPEDILVSYYAVHLMWRSDDFENLTDFQTRLSRVTEIHRVGLRDFGFYYLEETYDPSSLFQRMCAQCNGVHIPAPYGYRYCQTHLSEEEQVVIP